MKKTFIGIFSLILCISLLFSTISCQQKDQADSDAPMAGASVTEFELGGEYKIVRGEYYQTNSEILQAMYCIEEAITAVYGEKPDLCDDWQKKDEVNEYEILIGDTNRAQSQSAIKALKVNDYQYIAESPNVLVICGGSSEATLKCAQKFCNDVLGYDTQTKKATSSNVSVTVGTSYTYSDTYEFTDATVNGFDLKDITIAVKSEKQMVYAYRVTSVLAKYSGTVMPITTFEKLTGDEKGVICIGATDRSGKNGMKDAHEGYLITSNEEGSTLTIGIAVSDSKYYLSAMTALESNIGMTASEGTAVITLPEYDLYGFDYEDTIPAWYLKSEKNENVADGVVYTEQTYVDDENKPYKVYILTVDPEKATFRVGTSGDGTDYTLTKNQRQNTLEHINAAVTKGINVLAGVNADFFHINSDYHPCGLTVKEGVVIGKGESGRPYLAFTKDGKALIGANGQTANTTDIQTAVGGSHIIVKDGLPFELDMDGDFGYTSHPRTLAGIREDGTIVLVIVDGRQPKISNGAPLARCASLMISLGCPNAINLDGGGSSCMLTKSGSGYVTRNSPSDGGLRKVYNSLLVVGK